MQEDFKGRGGDTLDKLDVYIAHCRAEVHLAGDMTGSDPGKRALVALRAKYPDLADKLPPLGEALRSDSGISYTQWEAWLALYHGRLLFIAKAADSAERGQKSMPTDASRAAQAKHLARLKAMERYPDCTFTSPDNLAKYILSSAILDLLVKAQVLAYAEGLKKLRRARQPANPPPLSYLHNEDEELGAAILKMVWRSAWGKWYTAQSLANNAPNPVNEPLIMGTATHLVLDDLMNGQLQVRGRRPAQMDYESIPQTHWRSTA